MNQRNTEQIIYQLEKHLYPDFGKLQTFEISNQNSLIFSEITNVTLSYPQTTKKVVLKRLLAQIRKANQDLSLLVESEYQVLSYLYDRFSSLQKMNVIKPLAFLTKESVLVTENFPGDKLNALILGSLRFLPTRKKLTRITNYAFLTGRWLKHFHEFTKKEEVITLDRDSYIADLKDILELNEMYALDETLSQKIYDFVDKKFYDINQQQLELVGYHSDFTPWNILIKDDELRVLDFDRFSHRCRYEDLTLFLCSLDTIKSVVGICTKSINLLKRHFFDGYYTTDLNNNIMQLYVLKNTLKCLNMIDFTTYANVKYWDKKYERFRKEREKKVLLSNLRQLLDEKYLTNLY
jgi:hypothetical protein